MKTLTEHKAAGLSESCIRRLVKKQMEYEKIISYQENRIKQLEDALAELYNELDTSEIENSERNGIIEKVINLLKSPETGNIF